jgi:hypothetical protein
MVRCIKLCRCAKNLAVVDLELRPVGVTLFGCTWHVNGQDERILVPLMPPLGDDGAHWRPLIGFARSRFVCGVPPVILVLCEDAEQARDEFERHALAAIHEFVAQVP